MAPLTYTEAEKLLGVSQIRKLAHATWLERVQHPDGETAYAKGVTYAVRYHETRIIQIHPDDTYTLTTGGWWTAMTKARMQQYAPVRLAPVGGLWYFQRSPEWSEYSYPSLFYDGVRIDANGDPVGSRFPDTAAVEALLREKRQLDRTVSKYITGFAKDIQEHGLAMPGNGDCWGCLFSPTQSGGRPVKSNGTAEPLGLDHLHNHFEEGYYVPSLLWKAILEAGYQNPGYIWQDIIRDAREGKVSHFLTGTLRRYFMRRKPALLGLTATVPLRTGGVSIGQAIGASRAR